MSKTNLLVMLVDQMRMQAMGFWNTAGYELPYNNDPVHTPNLDRLARQSCVLSRAVSNSPVCSPYRGMFMSGRWAHQSGVPGNCWTGSGPDCELPRESRCWSDVLKEAGYSLGYIGKWHLDAPHEPFVDCSNNQGGKAWNEWCPPERRHGFDYWYSYGTFDHHLRPLYWRGEATRDDFHRVDQWGPEHEADLAIDYLRNTQNQRVDDRPFGLVVSMNPPHAPYDQVPDRYREPYRHVDPRSLVNRANADYEASYQPADHARKHMIDYLAMVTGVDEQVGRILEELEAQGLADDTVVLFTSDHGCCIGCHNQAQKSVWYEESIKVPFLLRWPGQVQPRHDPQLICSVPDLYPSLLSMLGLGERIPATVRGRDLSTQLCRGEGAYPTMAPYQLMPGGDTSGGRRGVYTGRYTLAIDNKAIVLHDNQTDPYQLRNIAEDEPEMVRHLLDEHLLPWLRQEDDPWLEPAQANSLIRG